MTTNAIFAAVQARQLNQIPGGLTAEQLTRARDHVGWTALHEAAGYAVLDQIKDGATVSQLARARERTGWTALHLTMKFDSVGQICGPVTVRGLASVADNAGRTALHSAVHHYRLHHLDVKATAVQLSAVRDRAGHSALSEIATQIDQLEGGATFDQLAAARGKFGYTPVNRLAEFGELNLIRGGVTAQQLRSLKPDKDFDALHVALWCCPHSQIKGGVPPGLVSKEELNSVLRVTLLFEAFNARELIRLGADRKWVLDAIREANANILSGLGLEFGNQIERMRTLLRLAKELGFSQAGDLLDPAVTAKVMFE